MKSRGLLLAFAVIVLTALACSLPAGIASQKAPVETQSAAVPVIPTQTLGVPTQALPVEITPTEALHPTAPPPPATAAPTQPVAAPTVQAQAAPGTVVLAKINGQQPGQKSDFRVADAVTGLTQGSFQASDLPVGPYPLVGGKSIFFTDFNSTGVHRVGFDGQAQDLTFMNPDQKVFDGVFLPSPDGSRIAWSRVLSMDAAGTHVQLIVANVDGSQQKTVLDENRPQPVRPEPVRWSNDGKSIYYFNMPYGIGGYILFYGGPDLQKVDLATGQSTQIVSTGCLCAVVLSPDETKVAYIQRPEGEQMNLFVRSLAGGEPVKANLPANHLQGGVIVWSPDGQSFLVTSALGNPDHEAYSVLLFHAADLSSKTLISDDSRLLVPVLWSDASVVWLNDKDGNAWRMDPASGSLTQTGNGERALSSTHY